MGDDYIPNDSFKLGGVKLYNQQVKKISTPKDEYGNTTYIINFKNGATIKYREQPEENNAEVVSCFYGNTNKRSIVETDMTNLLGAEFTGSKQHKDEVLMYDCKDCKIDVSNDKNTNFDENDTVNVWGKESKNNQIKQNAGDEVIFGYQPDMFKDGTVFEEDPNKKVFKEGEPDPYTER